MGLHIHDMPLVHTLFKLAHVKPSQAKIVEFGCGTIRPDLRSVCGKGVKSVRAYYTGLGAEHVSFDMNARAGSLARDLRLPITDKSFQNHFDVLLDLGTSEHVSYQYGVWRNAHQLVRVGGSFLHILPEYGRKKLHALGHYSQKFILKLSSLCEYRIYSMESFSPPTYVDKRFKDLKFAKLIRAILVKERDVPFPDFDTFATRIYSHFHIHERYRRKLTRSLNYHQPMWKVK